MAGRKHDSLLRMIDDIGCIWQTDSVGLRSPLDPSGHWAEGLGETRPQSQSVGAGKCPSLDVWLSAHIIIVYFSLKQVIQADTKFLTSVTTYLISTHSVCYFSKSFTIFHNGLYFHYSLYFFFHIFDHFKT